MHKILTAPGLLNYKNVALWKGATKMIINSDSLKEGYANQLGIHNTGFTWSVGQEACITYRCYYDSTYYEDKYVWSRIEDYTYSNETYPSIWVDGVGFSCRICFMGGTTIKIVTYRMQYVKVILTEGYLYDPLEHQNALKSKTSLSVARCMLPELNNADNYEESAHPLSKYTKCGPLYFDATTSSTEGLKYSTDGTTWNLCPNSIGLKAPKMYMNGMYHAFHSDYYLYYSTDGINWTKTNFMQNEHIEEFYMGYYGGTRIIAIAGNAYAKDIEGFYYSTNGTTWTKGSGINNEYGLSIHGLIHFNGYWYAAGYINKAGGFVYSSNGSAWSESSTLKNSWGSQDHVYDLILFKGYFYAHDWSYNYFKVLNPRSDTWKALAITRKDGYNSQLATGAGHMLHREYNYDTDDFIARLSYDGETWTQVANFATHYDDIICANGVWYVGDYLTIDFKNYFPKTGWYESTWYLTYSDLNGWYKINRGYYRDFRMNIRGYWVPADKLYK